MFDFIVDKDWLDRTGPFLFNFEHCLFIVFYIALAIFIALWLRKKSKEFSKKVMTILWIILLISEIIKWSASWYVWHIDGGIKNISQIFPLYTCSLITYLTPVALFSKNEKLQTAAKNFICTMLMPLGFVSIFIALLMTTECSILSFYGFHTVFFHAMMFIIASAMLGSGYYKPQKKDIYKSLTLFGSILVCVYIFNAILQTDYMYIYDGHTFTVFSFIINVLPHRICWTLIITAFYILIPITMHFIILKIQSTLEKRKAQKEVQTN